MKTLLLLSIFILVSLQGFGQYGRHIEKFDENKYKDVYKWYYQGITWVNTNNLDKYFKEWLSEEWQQYKQECYNDSTYWGTVWDEVISIGAYVDSIITRAIYTREKPTAEEFLDKLLKP